MMQEKGNLGESANGFCIRDDKWDLIYAQEKRIGITTNMEAEERAVCGALKFNTTKGYQQMIIETNSLYLKNIIQRV